MPTDPGDRPELPELERDPHSDDGPERAHEDAGEPIDGEAGRYGCQGQGRQKRQAVKAVMLCRPLLGGRGVARRKRYVLDVRPRHGRRERRRIDKRVLVRRRVTIGFALAPSFPVAGLRSAVLGAPSWPGWRLA